MKNKKITDWKFFLLLQTFSKKELTQLKYWLYAECQHERVHILRLFDLFYDNHPVLETKLELLWEELMPNKPYKAIELRKISARLADKIELYMAFQEFKQERLQKELFLLRRHNRQNEFLFFAKKLNKIQRLITDRDDSFESQAHFLFEVKSEEQVALIKQRKKPEASLIEEIDRYLDVHWMKEKFLLTFGANIQRQKYGDQIEIKNIKTIVEQLREKPIETLAPLFRVYLLLYRLIFEKEAEEEKLIDSVIELCKRVSVEDYQNIYNLLNDHYVRKLNQKGQRSDAEKIFLLHNWGLESKIILTRGVLLAGNYKNIINICLRLNKYELAFQRMETLLHLVPKSKQKDAYDFSLSNYYFEIGSYAKVLEILRDKKFNNIFEEIHARINLIQALYELDKSEPEYLVSKTETLKKFVRNQKELSKYHKESYLIRLNCFQALIKATDKKALRKLLIKIDESPRFDKRQWLRLKIIEGLGLDTQSFS